jgi:glycosyltransferase involved in cell wall biosynthesis
VSAFKVATIFDNTKETSGSVFRTVARRPILLIGSFLSDSGGTRSVCEELAERLTNRGWPVLTASRRRNRMARLHDILWTIVSQRKRYEVAQIDVFSGPAFIWAELACLTLRRLKKPYVLSLHGGNLPKFANRWKGRVQRLLAGANDVTAPSAYLRTQLGSLRSDIILLPNALDLGRYPFRMRSKPDPHLVWLRAFHDMYHPQLAVKTLALISARFNEARLTMIGPDKKDGSLERTRALSVELGVSDRIQIIPGVPKEQVPECLQFGDIFLNTSRADNMPVSVVEAMACGLCVISTEVGGIRHLIRDGEDGLLVPDDDAGAMVEAIGMVLSDPAVATRLSSNSRLRAEQFDWGIVLDKWETLLATAGVKGSL